MILHICAEGDWTGGDYRPPSLDTAGFVHCSDPGTTHLPANALYSGRTDLLLLEIDPARLGVPVRWEEGDPPIRVPTTTPHGDASRHCAEPAGIWFPHVYGPIRPEAVVAVHPFPPGEDGTFRLPAAIANR